MFNYLFQINVISYEKKNSPRVGVRLRLLFLRRRGGISRFLMILNSHGWLGASGVQL